ncbi:hypothetical protein DFP73DRAFT_593113 [Morchella snyderi]|nr:hypothetical protein DFP73DRAFT_593113 [Morchella snyderi]
MQIKSILLTVFAAVALVSAADVNPTVEQSECVEHATEYRKTITPQNPGANIETLCRDCRISSAKRCASAKKSSDEKLNGSTCYETTLSQCKADSELAARPQTETVAKQGGN